MAATGILSQKTFFPRSGDVLDDRDDSISWECVRAHAYTDPRTGTEVRYAMLVGRHAERGDAPIFHLIDDTVIPLPMLKTVDAIHRRRDNAMVLYNKNGKGNYEE